MEKAHTLCGATIGALEIWDGGHIRAFATRGLPGPFDERPTDDEPTVTTPPQGAFQKVMKELPRSRTTSIPLGS